MVLKYQPMVHVTLDFGLLKPLKWAFVRVEVNIRVFDADFLQHFGLILDMKSRRLIDIITKQSSKYVLALGNSL